MKKKTYNENSLLDTLLIGLLIIPYLLVKIGDFVRYMIGKIFALLSVFGSSIVDFFSSLGNKLRGLTDGISNIKINLPKFSLPVVKFPNIKLPVFTIPKPSVQQRVIGIRQKYMTLKVKKKTIKVNRNLNFLEKFKFLSIGVILTIVFVFLPYNGYLWLTSLPEPTYLTSRDIPATTKIFDRNGILLYEIYSDQNRTPLPLSEIPDFIKKATISIEDKDFYNHKGVSVKGIVRAFFENSTQGKLQGGSTLTQQLVRSALLTPEKTIQRKVKEAILAFWTEHLFTKDQILEMYLNQVPYGGTSWGIEAASETYFGKKVKDLTLAESALLAGLPAAPTMYSPFGSHPEFALDRQKEVLKRMRDDGYITEDEKNEAINEQISFAKPRISLHAPHFVMYVKDLLIQRYGERMVDQGGLRVTTSLDLNLQKKVEEILKNEIEKLKSLKVGNGAVLVTDPKTGEILAMAGSKDYFDELNDGNVNVVLSLRQPGSSIKVVNYASALERGFTAASILDDSPVSYPQLGGPAYAPVNYDGKFHGRVPLRIALANSYNIPAVKMLNTIGVGTMIDEAEKMGITTWKERNRFGLSLTLGGGEVTMLDMAEVYGVLANGGIRKDVNPFVKITDYKGEVIEEKDGTNPGVQVLPDGVAFILSNILADNNARAQAFGINSALVVPGKTVSVKTGTTNDKRDNWTIGYTPSYLTAVWVGNNNNTPMDPYLTSGITGAAPIWNQVMATILQNKADEVPNVPPTVISLPCYGRTEYFISGTEPKGGCAPLPTLTPTPTP
ncbi:MAG: Penicillin-binding protein, 1A family [Candidatus Gottesmanbacteria bacterium GW2011_GWA2_41_12]|uniref:Penicillin-binding protein, 1A family n=2 Tax=Candidatus Gottesmaniibacteriota TaxID=1752720 RepID=A0A0G0UHX5_9BACT|nr:MAG: Penicillin-binding protein, 1A family [Candidatus Gottesmanbacteria bacterium GW2011_GWC2_39_8]KKR88438.1 MAG: Penicillin-binding protein, 1A family [Candidatus Gottesmanbacteria bacterium GW2011_GWA2_41_12]